MTHRTPPADSLERDFDTTLAQTGELHSSFLGDHTCGPIETCAIVDPCFSVSKDQIGRWPLADVKRVARIWDKRAAKFDDRKVPEWEARFLGQLLGQARGDVLELGVGTGATFPYYTPSVTSLTALDVSEKMLDVARSKIASLPFPVTLLREDFDALPFPDASFDAVTSSLSLCGPVDPVRTFGEIRRVLRPGGRLLAMEHVRPANPVLGVVMDLLNPIHYRRVACFLNRPTDSLLRQVGFDVDITNRKFGGILMTVIATPTRTLPL